jgi:hypothetical protein
LRLWNRLDGILGICPVFSHAWTVSGVAQDYGLL